MAPYVMASSSELTFSIWLYSSSPVRMCAATEDDSEADAAPADDGVAEAEGGREAAEGAPAEEAVAAAEEGGRDEGGGAVAEAPPIGPEADEAGREVAAAEGGRPDGAWSGGAAEAKAVGPFATPPPPPSAEGG